VAVTGARASPAAAPSASPPAPLPAPPPLPSDLFSSFSSEQVAVLAAAVSLATGEWRPLGVRCHHLLLQKAFGTEIGLGCHPPPHQPSCRLIF